MGSHPSDDFESHARTMEALGHLDAAAHLNLRAAVAWEVAGNWEEAERCWREVCVCAERRADFASRRREAPRSTRG